MVAVISGNGLGLGNTSLTQLGLAQGGAANLGQAANGAYVNTATGNLVLQSNDEGLLFDGLPLNVLRTYNSLGQLNGNDGWSYGFSRNVSGLTGTRDTAGSTITRINDDGSAVVYTYNTSLGLYTSTDQSGTVDTLSWDATSSTWTWTDTADNQQETYDAIGELTTLTDTSTGASYSFSYSNGQLSQIVAGDGDTLIFGYNTSSQLISLSIQEVPPGQTGAVTRQMVSYGYDSQGRLSTVATTLGSDTDSTSNSYTTTYTYQDTTDLVASVTQSDGTTVSYSYTQDTQGAYQVTGITTGTGAAAQSLTLNYGTDNTTVTDGLGNATQYQYNASGELTAVIAPAINGSSPTSTYTYDANGNLLTSTDPDANVTSYSYDANGNLLSVEDGAGNTVSYTYDANNQVTSQTTYTAPAQGEVGQSGYVAPSDAQTTYYVYNANNQLAYTIDPLGNVSENDYIAIDGLSELISSRQYLGATYSTSGGSPSSPPSLAALQSWVASSAVQTTLSQGTRIDYSYDVRGQLATQTQYDTVNSSGTGVQTLGTVITTTTYDAQGRLLQTSTESGANRTTLQITNYIYDGLGRLIGKTDPLGNVTSYVYTDNGSNDTLVITQANGLITTQVRNSAGQVLGHTQSASGQASRATSYLYNADGEQVAAIDPSGAVTYTFYNADGEVSGTVDGDGNVTAYTHDADGRVISTTQYATPNTTVSTWISGGGLTASYPVSLPVPTSTANDRTTTSIYNEAGQVVATIDPAGNVTTTTYNAVDDVLSTTQYASALTTTQRSALGGYPTLAALQVDLAANANNRATLTIYDADGHAVATIDAAGNVIVTTYNAAGEAVLSTTYATALTSSQLSSLGDAPTLAALQADITTSTQDQTTRNYYDDDGRVVAGIDADGYLTTTAYDETTDITTTTRYATALTSSQLSALNGTESVAALVGFLASDTANEQSSVSTDGDGEVTSRTAADGTVTTYTYNGVGQVLSTIVTPTSGQGTARTTSATYDAFGNELTATDAAGATTTYVYNAQGRPIEATDADGNSTWSYYDADGHLLYTVQGQPSGSTLNAVGNVTAYAYNAFGEMVSKTTYAASLTLSTGSSSGSTLNPTGATSAQVATAIAALSAVMGDASRVTSTTYTTVGQVATVTDGDGYETATSYDAFGDAIQVQQQLSQPGSALSASNSTITDVTYDNRGEQIGATQAVGTAVAQTGSQTYDAFGRVTSRTDGNGNTITYSYDNLGRQVSTSQTVQGSGRTTQTTYDAFGNVLTETDALGNTTSYSYSIAAHATTVTTPDGVTMTKAKDAYGDTVSVTDGGGNSTTYTYDADGRLLTTKDALGNLSSDQYDAEGDLIQTSDATGHVVTYTYSASGQVLTKTVDPNGLNLTTRYNLDAQGRQLSVTDPTGAVTTSTYDADGNVLTRTNALGSITTYTYDGGGKTLTVTSGAGTGAAITTQYVYDNLERLSQTIVDPGQLNLTTTYSYDADSNLIAKTDANGNVTQYVYDQAGEQIFAIDPTGAVTKNTYDADGRLTATRGYATPLSASQLSALGSAPTIAAVTADLAPSASDHYTQNVYNTEGQVVYQLSGSALDVTQYIYDNAGQVTQTRQYATALSGTTVSTTATAATIASLVTPSSSDLLTTTVYNADGEAVYAIDGAGGVTQTTYDASGRVTQTKAYATALTGAQLSSLGGTPTSAQIAALITSSTNDRTTYASYNNAGETIYTVNAAGAVMLTTYDADGRVTSTDAYATPLSSAQLATLDSAPTSAQIAALVTSGSSDQISYNVYDSAGELRYSINPMGYVTENRYNATGQVTETLAYANPVSTASEAGALQAGTALGWLDMQVGGTTGSNPDSTAEATLNLYDAAGRVAFVVRQNGTAGQVTGYTYDANGNVLSQTAYGSTLTISTGTSLSAQFTTASVASAMAAFTNREINYTVYDGDNRAIYTINALNGVTQNNYDGVGRLIGTQQYANAITLPGTISATTIAAAVTSAGGSTGERLTSVTYNSLDQVLTTSDALGVNATYTYNALGEKVSYANRDGDVWNYSYDSAGRLVQTQSPSVTVTTYNGTLQTGANQNLYTTTTYDAFGDVLSTIQGYGSSANAIINVSTTSYVYNTLGMRTQIINALGDSSTTIYNALGQAVVNTDANDNHTYNVYNVDGQLIDSIDGNGYITAYTYDAYGNVITTTQYAAALNTSAITGWSAGQPLSAAQLQQGLVPSSSDRTTTTAYNQLNQKTQVVQSSIAYVLSMGALGGDVTNGSPTTTYTYDAYGNVTSTSQLVQGAYTSGSTTTPAIWETTYSYYDALNRAVMVVTPTGSYTSPLGYVTTKAYDAFGMVSSTTQYAQAISTIGITAATAPGLPSAATQASGADRITSYTYDAIGRVLTETDTGGYTYTGGTVGQLNGTAGYSIASSVTSYSYNGQNQVLAETVNGATTTTIYDALGRVLSVTAPPRQVLVGNWQSILESTPADDLSTAALYISVSPVTSYGYDALGDAVSTTTSAGGLTQQSYATYSALGQQTESVDAEGNVHSTAYDANGNVLARSYLLTAGVTVTTTNAYDADNHLLSTAVQRSNASSPDSYIQQKYNAFGEVIAKGDGNASGANGGYEVQYTYNNAGQQTGSPNGTTGALHSYGYDLVGNLVLDTSTITGGSATVFTQDTYNLSNQSITQLTPTTGAASGENSAAISNSYDRWGNVIARTDANGNVTTYRYDSQNHLVEESEATVLVVSASGVYTWITPTKTWNYNIDGELMLSADENGNLTQYTYDAAGNQTLMEDGASAKTYTAYDALGRAAATETPPVQTATATLSNIKYTTYNNLNQVTGQGYFLVNPNGTSRSPISQEAYVLNANGDRIATYDGIGSAYLQNGDTANAAKYAITYTYDSQHRVLSSTTPLNETTTYVYDVNGNLIHETDADGNTQSWVYNDFGQVQSHVDESGAAYNYTYDANSGLMTGETSNWTPGGPSGSNTSTLTYGYEAGGQLASLTEVLTSGSSSQTSTYGYGYDAYGDETLETASTYDGGGNSVKTQVVVSYDSHNRLQEVTDENTSGSTPVATMRTAYVYDADGNRRAVFASSAYDLQGTSSTPVNATPIPLGTHATANTTAPSLASALANQTATLSGASFAAMSYSTAANFSDPLGMGLTYTATGLPSWLSINTTTGVISGTPPTPTAPASYTVTVTGMDVLGYSVSSSFTVTVPTVSPVFNSAPAAQTAQPAVAWSYVAPAATDANGYGVTYSASGMPPGISFNATTHTFSGTPSTGGAYTVTYTATPGTGSATTTTFTITVPYATPVFSGGVSNQTVQPGTSLNYQAPAATDANGYGVTYSATGMPPGISFNATTRTFSGSLTANGTWTVTYKATPNAGSGASVSETFNITVPTVTPVFSGGMANQSGTATLAANAYTAPAATDANGASITYSASGLPPGISFNASTRVFSGTPTTAGTYTVTYSATASTGSVASATFTFTVNAASPPVSIGGPSPANFTFGRSATAQPLIFTNPMGRALVYSISWPTGNIVAHLTINSSGVLVYSPPAVNNGVGGDYILSITATDLVDGLSDTQNVQVVVASGSQAAVVVQSAAVASAATPAVIPAAAPAPSPTPNVQADWFTYDADNRVLVADGSLQAGSININNGINSGANVYDAAGDIIQYISLNSSGQQTVQKNYYSQLGQLSMVQTTAPGGTTFGGYESRSYDADGRLVQDVIFNAPGSEETTTSGSFSDAGWVRTDTIYTYNADGELTDQSEYAEESAANLISSYGSNVATSTYANEDKVAPTGLPTVGATTDGPALYLVTENSYVAGSGYGYDADGNVLGYHTITGTEGTVANSSPTGATVGYQNVYVRQNGLLLSTTTQVAASGSNTVTTSNTYNDLGDLAVTTGLVNGVTQTQDMAYTAGGQLLQMSTASSGTSTYTYYAPVNEQQLGSVTSAGAINVLSTTGGFSNSSSGTQSYTVQAGDTLQSLAQEIYGDSNYYYILAQANGLSPSAALSAGMVLHIPQVTTSANAYNTYQPYSTGSDISGGAAGLETAAAIIATSINAIFNQQSTIAQTVAQIEAQAKQEAAIQQQIEQELAEANQAKQAAAQAQQAATQAAANAEQAQQQAQQAQQAAMQAQQQAKQAQQQAQQVQQQANGVAQQIQQAQQQAWPTVAQAEQEVAQANKAVDEAGSVAARNAALAALSTPAMLYAEEITNSGYLGYGKYMGERQSAPTSGVYGPPDGLQGEDSDGIDVVDNPSSGDSGDSGYGGDSTWVPPGYSLATGGDGAQQSGGSNGNFSSLNDAFGDTDANDTDGAWANYSLATADGDQTGLDQDWNDLASQYSSLETQASGLIAQSSSLLTQSSDFTSQYTSLLQQSSDDQTQSSTDQNDYNAAQSQYAASQGQLSQAQGTLAQLNSDLGNALANSDTSDAAMGQFVSSGPSVVASDWQTVYDTFGTVRPGSSGDSSNSVQMQGPDSSSSLIGISVYQGLGEGMSGYDLATAGTGGGMTSSDATLSSDPNAASSGQSGPQLLGNVTSRNGEQDYIENASDWTQGALSIDWGTGALPSIGTGSFSFVAASSATIVDPVTVTVDPLAQAALEYSGGKDWIAALSAGSDAPNSKADLIRSIGDVIASGEGGYESYNTGQKGVPDGRTGHSFYSRPAGTVTGKTINEILATESLPGTDVGRFFATGKYQTTIPTLRQAVGAMNLSGNELYDASMQEQVFADFLFTKAGKGGLGSYVNNGVGTIDDAQYAAAHEWASIAAPAGMKISDGRISDGTLSYYESIKNHASMTSTAALRNLLSTIGK
ncbi:LysM peptidoglycan-binding domain-containing protein [Dyella kyungheensis]|uniref:LysM peptidoglycan-binding domain-containing protein n=1 Tax=Dyella kyungheensis TaxID=1242174 RepID=UPI003CE902D1